MTCISPNINLMHWNAVAPDVVKGSKLRRIEVSLFHM